jgi:Condensation domain/Phosphopantetheine attachment site
MSRSQPFNTEVINLSLRTREESAQASVRNTGGTDETSIAADPLSRSQEGMLFIEEQYGSDHSPFHILVSAEITGQLDTARLKHILARVVDLHPALRTVFRRDPETGLLRSSTLPRWEPVILEQELPALPPGADSVDTVQSALGATSGRLLRPYRQPPIVFVLTHVSHDRNILSILAHHAITDGWSLRIIWDEIAEMYAAGPNWEALGVTDDPGMALIVELEETARKTGDAAARAVAIAGWRSRFDFSGNRSRTRSLAGHRLIFSLSKDSRDACASLSVATAVSRNAVLLAAWGLSLGLRAGTRRLLVGVPGVGRPTASAQRVVGSCANLVPVPCEIRETDSVANYLRRTARAALAAMAAGSVPYEDITGELGLLGESAANPLVQFAFVAEDEVASGALTAADISLKLRIGHCGGTNHDASLLVLRWDPDPVLALEYATSVLSPGEAASLANGFDRALVEMGHGPDGLVAAIAACAARGSGQILGRTAEAETVRPPKVTRLVPTGAARDLGSGKGSDGNLAQVITEIENVWLQVLGHAQFGRDDNFLTVGGDSVLMLRMQTILSARYGDAGVTLSDLYECLTVDDLARRVLAGQSGSRGLQTAQ